MEYKPNYFFQNYAERTWINYKKMLELHKEDLNSDKVRVYEVTQLINSFFGILITPYEAAKPYKDKKNPENTLNSYQSTLEKMRNANGAALSNILRLIETLKKEHRYYNNYTFDNVNQDLMPVLFIERIRNALSHGGDTGLRFYPATVPAEEEESTSCISSVIFQDKHIRENFVVELTIDELEGLLNSLYCIFINYPIIEMHKAKKHKRKIDELRRIMQSEES